MTGCSGGGYRPLVSESYLHRDSSQQPHLGQWRLIRRGWALMSTQRHRGWLR